MSKGYNGQASVDYAQEIKQLKEQNAALCQEVEMLKDEIIRLVSRNLDMAEQLEESSELRRRVEVAREIFRVNYERQRNADLLDDGQLMALLELRIESERSYFQPDFDAAALAEKMGVSTNCSASRPSTAPPKPISTICACLLVCACCANILSIILLS